MKSSGEFLLELDNYVDPGLYCGPYPFRRLPAQTPGELREFMATARIAGCIATPFPSVFYNQNRDGLTDWLAVFGGDPEVRFWAVVNPKFPGWEQDLAAAVADPLVAGIRLYPRCHGYALHDPALVRLLDAAAETGMPVNLTARLLDDRLYPPIMRVGPPIDTQEVCGALKRWRALPWVLSCFFFPEIKAVAGPLAECPEAFVDIGSSKFTEEWWEDLSPHVPARRLLLGTGAPLYYHAGIRLTVQHAMNADERRLVLRDNAQRLLALRCHGQGGKGGVA